MRVGAPIFLAVVASACASSCDRASEAAAPVMPPPPARRAILEQVSGDVRIKRSDGDEWLPVTPGIALSRDDKIRTAKSATALIRFDEGTELAIDGESMVSISDLPAEAPGKGGVTVLRGKVDAEVDRNRSAEFSVKTPAAIARASKEIVFQ
jgi:hypothetical protein